MSNWDIRAAEAMGVVGKAAGSAQGYDAEVKSIGTELSGLGSALSRSVLVQKSLSDYSENVIAKHLALVAGHTFNALRGTADAVRFYDQGQLEMAASAQASAAKADLPDMPGAAGAPGSGGGAGGGR